MHKKELLHRMITLQEAIKDQGLDCYLVASEDNIWYLTGVTYRPEERPFFIVVPVGGKPTLIVPKLEEMHLAKVLIECTIVSYWEYPSPAGSNWYDLLQQTIQKYKRVGTETGIKAAILEQITADEVIKVDLVDEMRKIKSSYELEMIRATAGYCDRAMGKIFKNAYLGATVVEPFSLSRSVQTELIRSKKFDPITTSLLTAVWPAPASAMPHSIPGLDEKLNRGPNVAMCYFRINGYAAECERTFFLGAPEKDEAELFHHMLCARKRALSVLKAGVKCSDIDAEARDYLIQKGFENNLLHRTGHGIGLGNHEAPWIAEGNAEELRENMVISIEPGIYFPGAGGYRHSDTVLVKKEGYELLTGFPTELADMTVTSANTAARLKGRLIQRALKL